MRETNNNIELATVLENITDAFFALDSEWRFTYLNAEAERVLQRSKQGLLGESLWDEFPEAIGLTFEREYRRAVEEQRTVEFEEYFPPLETWFEVKAYPSEAGLAVYFRDINRRKQAEEDLRRSEERLRAVLVQYGSDIITIVGADGTITYESPASERVLGYRPEDLIGTNAFDRIHPDDMELVRQGFAEILSNPGAGRPIETRFRHADGSWRYFEVLSNNLLEDPDVRGVVINSRDITERLLQERSEVIETSADGIAIADTKKGYTYVNEAHARMHGYDDPAELLGESWRILYEADQTEWLVRHVVSVLEEKGYWRGEAVGRRRDGSLFQQETSLSMLDPGKIVCVVRDATSRKEAERRLTWLASFPELNPNPILEVHRSGALTYANPVAEQLFPDLHVLGTDHPLLTGYGEDINTRLRESSEGVLVDEVRVGEHFYQRA